MQWNDSCRYVTGESYTANISGISWKPFVWFWRCGWVGFFSYLFFYFWQRPGNPGRHHTDLLSRTKQMPIISHPNPIRESSGHSILLQKTGSQKYQDSVSLRWERWFFHPLACLVCIFVTITMVLASSCWWILNEHSGRLHTLRF